jgi:hypothetical protein
MAQTLSVLSSLLLIAVVAFYMANVIRGLATPNPVFFFVRSVLAIMNAVTYFAVVQHDFFKWLTTAISATALTLVFFYSLVTRRFPKVRTVDVLCLMGAVLVGICWKMTNGVTANLLLQLVMTFAFSPQIIGVATNMAKERPLPWTLSVLAYVCMTIVVCLDWKGWEGLIHPLTSGIIGNGLLMIFAIRQHQWRWRSVWT